ncbi:MAG: methionyl-tRNA formyltransferase [Rickettsiaceae bacterium]|nr:methionyl-tRNA formyltransferase [Rickettsiaceae bacterium]
MRGSKKSLIFMGTPEFAAPSLRALIRDHEVRAVFTSPPKPAGRGMEIKFSPVYEIAAKNNIQIHTPRTLKDRAILDIINTIDADIIVVCAYGFIIPPSILSAKKYGCINLHPSRLPKFRGASPLQHTIIEGETESSICIIQMDAGLDTGPILLQKDFSMPYRATLAWLHDYTAKEGAELISNVVSNIENLKPVAQNLSGASYASKLSKDDSYINWVDSAEKIDCGIRGRFPWPGSYMKTNLGDIKIIEAKPFAESSSEESYNKEKYQSGQIIDSKKLIIACGDGLLKIEKLQVPGGKQISALEFFNSKKLEWIS